MFTHRVERKWTADNETLNAAFNVTGGAESNIDEAIPDSSVDLTVVFNLDVSEVKVLFILSDQDISIETNDGVAPDNTFDLAANVPFLWTSEDGPALTDTDGVAVTSDITSLHVTNSAGVSATLQIRSLFDPTPD